MQPLLLTLLIGTAFAMVNAAPAQNKLQRLQAILEGDDDQAKAQIFGAIVRHVLPSVLGGVLGNEMKLAGIQESDDAEIQRRGLGRSILKHGARFLGGLGAGLLSGGGEEPAKVQDEDAEIQRRGIGRVVGNFFKKHGAGLVGGLAGTLLGGGGGEEEPAKLQDEDDDDAAARQALLDAIQARVAMMEDDDDDDMVKAQFLGRIVRTILG